MEILKGKVGTVRLSTDNDIYPIAENMRESDVIELRDGSGQTPLEALEKSYKSSKRCLTITIDDEPVAMFGVSVFDYCSDHGIIWYLATDRWDKEGRRDMRMFSRFFVETLQDKLKSIGNLVDCRNSMSIKWLMGLDFKCLQVVTSPISGKPFALMVRDNPNV